MQANPDHHPADHGAWRSSPLVWAAGCWALGLVVGRAMAAPAGGWLGLAAVGLIAGWRLARRSPAAANLLLAAAVVCVGAGWWQLRTGPIESNTTLTVPQDDWRVARLEGVIADEPYTRLRSRGLMGRFDYRPPKTMFVLRVDRQHSERGARPVRARVLVSIPAYDGRLRKGDRIRCTGWLGGFTKPKNPGQRDFAERMRRRGITARLTLNNRRNCELIQHAERRTGWLPRLRDRLRAESAAALFGGMSPEQRNRVSAGLLGRLLLGQRGDSSGMQQLKNAFRETGLAHFLAISGLHLGILVAVGWWIALALTGRPPWAAAVAVGLIALLLLTVPPRVPVIRAGVMTATGCIALTWGRRLSPIAVMAGAGLALLIWRPADLFAPGFQLSFAVVTGLLLFTERTATVLLPPSLADAGPGDQGLRRYGAGYLAVGVVGWAVSMPLVAHHFQMVSPLSILLAVAMLPVVGVVLWAGYIKILLTTLWPALGAVTAVPLLTLADGMVALVRASSGLPGAVLWVPESSPAWAATTLAVAAAVLGGRLTRRPAALAGCLLLCAGWLFWPALKDTLPLRRGPALTMHTFAIGNGSCHLLRSDGEAWVFDCGSANYLDITTATVGPAMRHLGVTRVHTLVLSHPDLDHFSGALELIDRFGVRRVVTTERFTRRAERAPHSAAGFLIHQIRQRGVPLETARRGWTDQLGHASVRALWPPAERDFQHDNDGSLMLSVRAAGRRLLLCGDVQDEAMVAMLEEDLDLTADAVELPHHGSFVNIGPRWLRAVDPRLVVQSCGLNRVRDDEWHDRLGDAERFMTARDGMTTLTIGPDGTLRSRAYLSSSSPPTGDTTE